MTEQFLQNLRKLIQDHNIHAFYKTTEWLHLRLEVLKEQNNECQICKAKKIYTKATTVHHVNYVRRHPELALSKFYEYMGKKLLNLLAVCDDCHKEIHKGYKPKGFTNNERW